MKLKHTRHQNFLPLSALEPSWVSKSKQTRKSLKGCKHILHPFNQHDLDWDVCKYDKSKLRTNRVTCSIIWRS